MITRLDPSFLFCAERQINAKPYNPNEGAKMKTRIVVGICLFVTVSAAYAENFVDMVGATGSAIKDHAVDVDSIRKSDDGFVYFTEKNPMGLYNKVVDCQKRIWKSNGREVVPGSYGALLADFVCSRAP